MPGAKLVLDVTVVFRTLVGIFDQQADRCPRGPAFENAGQYLHAVRFVALRRVSGAARATTVEIALDVRLIEFHPRRATVDHTAQCSTMAFAESRNDKKSAEAVT
jgi:hypothetical protein